MLKILSVLLLTTASIKSYSSEYIITIKDKYLNEEIYKKVSSELEVGEVISEVEGLNDENLLISIKKLKAPISTLGVKRGGGEGSGD